MNERARRGVGLLRSDAMEQWVVYGPNTRDFPGQYVVRRAQIAAGVIFNDVRPTAVVPTLEEARAMVPIDAFCIPRHPEDDPVIVEVWL